jgi:hypothetical protein
VQTALGISNIRPLKVKVFYITDARRNLENVCTGCGRMDSHISKGNKKRTKQVTEKSFIFSKSTYNLVFSH